MLSMYIPRAYRPWDVYGLIPPFSGFISDLTIILTAVLTVQEMLMLLSYPTAVQKLDTYL